VNDVEFIDIALLRKIDAETTVESFGPKINSTFFETANLLGALKIKGFIDIHSSIGNSPVIISERGKMLLKELDVFSQQNLSRVDLAVLGNIKGGIKDPKQIESLLNVNARDIAFSIYKLHNKGFVDYRVKNAAVELLLTTKGFEQDNPDVKMHAIKAEMRSPAEVVNAPSELKNKIAHELAKEDITVDETASANITEMDRLLANIAYYKWYIMGGVVLASAVAIALLLLVK